MKGVLKVRNLSRHYKVRRRARLLAKPQLLKAVDDISFEIAAGEMLGIVGESGSGKSTTARLVLGHIPATTGEVWFGNERVDAANDAAWRRMRSRMQMIYQDPLGALDPRIPVAIQIGEPLIVHCPQLSVAEREARVEAAMADVGLSGHHGTRFPHELSGGQRQRVIIARALVTEPELLVCDEPVSALDVSVQAQVLNVFEDIRARRPFTGLFISHDLKVIHQIADRVAVMYLGRIVEIGRPEDVFREPLHPYTRALVSALPQAGVSRRDRIVLPGEPPSPIDIPSGCSFRTRCPIAIPLCAGLRPELRGEDGHAVACHRVSPPDTVEAVEREHA